MAIGLQEVTVLKISVVVCTYNRAQLLSACLESICSNLLPDCQLLVIDNGSTDNTKQVVEGFRWPTYVPESRPGHSSARNAGVAASTGDLIVFTDDDVVVDPGWLEALTAPFEDPRVAATGGRILHEGVTANIGEHASLVELIDYGESPFEFAGGDNLPVGANMAIRRSLLKADPLFDPRLGNTRGLALANEEFEMMHRLVLAGHRLVYCPTAVVRHRPLPGRTTSKALRRAAFHHGFGMARRHWIQGELQPSPRQWKRVVAAARPVIATRIRRQYSLEQELSATQQLGWSIEEWLMPRVNLANTIARYFPV